MWSCVQSRVPGFIFPDCPESLNREWKESFHHVENPTERPETQVQLSDLKELKLLGTSAFCKMLSLSFIVLHLHHPSLALHFIICCICHIVSFVVISRPACLIFSDASDAIC